LAPEGEFVSQNELHFDGRTDLRFVARAGKTLDILHRKVLEMASRVGQTAF
jgi:hypothetical protein